MSDPYVLSHLIKFGRLLTVNLAFLIEQEGSNHGDGLDVFLSFKVLEHLHENTFA